MEADPAELRAALLEGRCDTALTYGLGMGGAASSARCLNECPRMYLCMPDARSRRVPASKSL
jgi:hypothetical protein